MRLARGLAFALWLMVALLGVAGFAAFSPETTQEAPAPNENPPSAGADWGTNSGRVVALTFISGLRATPGVVDQAAEDALVSELLGQRRTKGTARPADAGRRAPLGTGDVLPPSPTSPSTENTPPSSDQMSEAEVRGVLALFFDPEDIDLALEITFCESRWDPDATNPTSGAAGLFQQIPRFWADRSTAAGWTGADIYDPHANTAVSAWLVYEGGGWVHWAASVACWGS